MVWYYSPDNQVLTWQVVVPTGLRVSVLVAAHDGLFGGHMGVKKYLQKGESLFFLARVPEGSTPVLSVL